MQLIQSFSNLEMKRLGRYLQAPHITTNQDILLLFDVLKKHYPTYTAARFTEANIYKRIYGKAPFHKAKFQDLFSKLLRIVERFLLDIYLDKQPQKREVLLTAAIGERLYTYNQQKTAKLMDKIDENQPFRTAEDFYQLFELSHQAWYHADTDKLTNDDRLLLKSQEYLDKAYLLRKLEFIVALSDRAKFLTTQSTTLLTDIKEKFLGETVLENNEYNMLFRTLIQFHTVGNLSTYQQFKTKLLSVFPNLTTEYKKDFLVRLLNIAINLNLSNPAITLQETFDLYQIGVAEKVFLNNGKMRDIEFANICIYGFKLGHDQWTERFIKEHQSCLHESERVYLIPFVNAYKCLFNQEFEAVIQLLRDVQPKQHLKYYGRIQALLIRAFFECLLHQIGNYENVLTAYLTSFKTRMQRNKKIAAMKKEGYLNFIKVVQKLVPFIQHPQDKKRIVAVRQLLTVTNPIFFKSWLHEKLLTLEETTSQNREVAS